MQYIQLNEHLLSENSSASYKSFTDPIELRVNYIKTIIIFIEFKDLSKVYHNHNGDVTKKIYEVLKKTMSCNDSRK